MSLSDKNEYQSFINLLYSTNIIAVGLYNFSIMKYLKDTSVPIVAVQETFWEVIDNFLNSRNYVKQIKKMVTNIGTTKKSMNYEI